TRVQTLKPNVSRVRASCLSDLDHAKSIFFLITSQADYIAHNELRRDLLEQSSATAHIHCFGDFNEGFSICVHSPQANGEHGCDSLFAAIAETTTHRVSLVRIWLILKLRG